MYFKIVYDTNVVNKKIEFKLKTNDKSVGDGNSGRWENNYNFILSLKSTIKNHGFQNNGFERSQTII